MAGAMRRARKRTAPDPGLPKKAGANILSVCQTWHRGTGRGEVRHRTPNMHPHEAERDMNEERGTRTRNLARGGGRENKTRQIEVCHAYARTGGRVFGRAYADRGSMASATLTLS